MPLEEHPPGLGVGVHSSSLTGVVLGKDEVRHGHGGQATHALHPSLAINCKSDFTSWSLHFLICEMKLTIPASPKAEKQWG